MQASRMLNKRTLVTFIALALLSLPLLGQRTSSEKNLETDSVSRGPAAPLNHEDFVLKIVKLKGSIGKIDLEKRTIIVVPKKKKEGDLELAFSQPEGKEQIDVSKKAAKRLGKKTLELEELKPGSTVQLSYYPTLMQLMDLTVEQLAR